jgi:hypothetical protein
MKYELKTFITELESKEYPHLNPAQFDQLVGKTTADFVNQMTKLQAQFVALQDMTPLAVNTQFFPVAGTMAVRRLHTYDAPGRNHFVQLEANALVEVAEVDQLLPGEKPLAAEQALNGEVQGKAN